MEIDESQIIAHTGMIQWSHANATRIYEVGDVLRLCSLILMLITASRNLFQKKKMYTLVGVSIVAILELLTRYPLSVKEKVMQRQIVVFSTLWALTLTLYLIPIISTMGGIVIGVIVLALVMVFLILTKKL